MSSIFRKNFFAPQLYLYLYMSAWIRVSFVVSSTMSSNHRDTVIIWISAFFHQRVVVSWFLLSVLNINLFYLYPSRCISLLSLLMLKSPSYSRVTSFYIYLPLVIHIVCSTFDILLLCIFYSMSLLGNLIISK